MKNGRGDVIFVEEHYFIRDPPAPHAMSEAEKSSIKAPQIKEEIAKMDGAKWLLFAQEVAFYYKRGGEKPIASYVSSKNLELLALKFHMELSAFLALTPQKQVYQFLKSFWEKPEERPGQLLEDIRKIELLPAAKGNVEMVVLEFMMRVKTVMNGVATFLKESPSRKIQRWRLAVQMFTFRSEHVEGVKNIEADSLSRINLTNPW